MKIPEMRVKEKDGRRKGEVTRTLRAERGKKEGGVKADGDVQLCYVA